MSDCQKTRNGKFLVFRGLFPFFLCVFCVLCGYFIVSALVRRSVRRSSECRVLSAEFFEFVGFIEFVELKQAKKFVSNSMNDLVIGLWSLVAGKEQKP
jgi:hypothetical protein